MANHYGYAYGDNRVEYIGVDKDWGATKPATGDMVYLSATNRLLPCAENATEVFGVLARGSDVAVDSGGNDDQYKLPVYISTDATFRYPVDTGETVDASYVGKEIDLAGKQTVQIDETSQAVVKIANVDIENNAVYAGLIASKRGS